MRYSPPQDVVFVQVFYCSTQLLRRKRKLCQPLFTRLLFRLFRSRSGISAPIRQPESVKLIMLSTALPSSLPAARNPARRNSAVRMIPVIMPTISRFLPCFMPAAQPAATAERKLMQELAYPMVESFAPSDAYRTAAQPRRARLQRHQTPTARIKKNKLI